MDFRCRRLIRLAVAVASIMLNACSHRDDTSSTQISFWISDAPFSADPLDYDAFIHHIAFSSVHAGLVTNYKAGQYTGIIAREWEVSPDQKIWRFTLRDNLRFENGDPITPRDVVASWLRMAKLMNQRGSRSGFFEKLAGYSELGKTGRIAGLDFDDKHVSLRLTEPVPQLLDLLSFGLYAVVHPSCYEKDTGKWLDPKRTVASGPYSIKAWDDSSFVLKLRADFPAELLHPRPLAEVKMEWAPEKRLTADILSGNSREKLASGGYSYHGETESRIAYMRCQSWSHPNSPLHDKTERKRLREAFYSKLAAIGFKPTLSFFPLAIPTVREFPRDPNTEAQPAIARGLPLRYKPYAAEVTPLAELSAKALEQAATAEGFRAELKNTPKKTIGAEFASGLPVYHNDIVGIVTGILINSPDADIRFMFKSQEGIRLPDPTGRSAELIAQDNIDVQKVNEVLWDDAIIWPVAHLSLGLWARNDLDFSLINTIVPPTAIHLIGRK